MNPIKVLFICHGNICRSPMAEIIFKHLVHETGLDDSFHIESAGVSPEEWGNPIYSFAQREIEKHGLKVDRTKHARAVGRDEYDDWDCFIVMERSNERGLLRIFGGDPQNKIHYMMEYTDTPGDVEDPWYSRNFSKVWDQIYRGCEGLLRHQMNQPGD